MVQSLSELRRWLAKRNSRTGLPFRTCTTMLLLNAMRAVGRENFENTMPVPSAMAIMPTNASQVTSTCAYVLAGAMPP